MPRRTPCTVQTIERLADLRVRLHEHFMADGVISPVEHAILVLHEEAAYVAERADYGRRALIAVLDHADDAPTERQEYEWSQLELLRTRVYGHASQTVAAV